MDIFQTTKNQINRHVMDAINQRLDEAKTIAARENYSLPYEFLSDSQRLTLIDFIAVIYTRLELADLRKQLNKA
jgi:hypothetical protein